ncbi:9789_t:CDS:2, partial [Acaulospora morrowiae]
IRDTQLIRIVNSTWLGTYPLPEPFNVKQEQNDHCCCLQPRCVIFLPYLSVDVAVPCLSRIALGKPCGEVILRKSKKKNGSTTQFIVKIFEEFFENIASSSSAVAITEDQQFILHFFIEYQLKNPSSLLYDKGA